MTIILLLIILLVFPAGAWSQEEISLAPGVKALAALNARAFDWSPDGRRLAYAMDDGVWIVEAPRFQQPKHVIRSGSIIGQIRWSPDGRKLAFSGGRPGDGWGTIWIAEADGSCVRDLLPPGAPFGSPGNRALGIGAWLNNREIVFERHCGTGCVDFHKVDVESKTYGGLTFVRVDEELTWSPTKERIIIGTESSSLGVVEAKRFKRVPSRAFSYTLPPDRYRALIKGCTIKNDRMGDEYHFDGWSPDGKWVLYRAWLCFRPPAVESEVNLYRWNVESGHREKLLSNAGWASWSPDGSQIAFILLGKPRYNQSGRIISTDFVLNQPFRAYVGVMDVRTKKARILMSLEPGPIVAKNMWWWHERPWTMHPLWSPDSQSIVIRDIQRDLFLVRVDGSSPQRLTRGMEQVEASWSPDGKRLALWLLLRSDTTEKPGLKRFLPPVGKEVAALSDAEIIERYFKQALDLGPYALENYRFFMAQYACALRAMGRKEAAEKQRGEARVWLQQFGDWQADVFCLEDYSGPDTSKLSKLPSLYIVEVKK
jgi:dipeptidyl aminopeptidase/acylaminoacyl peptidase